MPECFIDPAEAIDLLLSLAIAEKLGSPLFLKHLPSVKRKISKAFADMYHGKINDLRNRIFVGAAASNAVLASHRSPNRTSLPVIAQAFFEMRSFSSEYADQSSRSTERIIEPQFFYFNMPVWYVLSWDNLRSDIRFFRIDRIRSATLLPGKFRLRNRSAYLAKAEEGVERL